MYCGSCGTKLNLGARFCRACGSPQEAGPEPPPPPPTRSGPVQAVSETTIAAGLLAITAGAAMVLLTAFATIYQPLHYDYPVNYGISVQFGDFLTFGLGAAIIFLGASVLSRPGNLAARGWALLASGLTIFLFSVVWALTDLTDLWSRPFYFGFVAFAEFGRVEVDSHLVQAPLLIAGAMAVGAGLLVLSGDRQSISFR